MLICTTGSYVQIHQIRVVNIPRKPSAYCNPLDGQRTGNPSCITDFLGLYFNLETVIISPPAMPVRKLSSIISCISHFTPFIHHGRLQLRFLQFWSKWHWTQHRQYRTHITTGCRISISPALVQQTGCSQGSSFTAVGTQPILFHRRFPYRLGSQLARSSPLRTMVSTGLQSAHQLVRTGSHPSCSPQVGTSLDQSDSPSLLRQQYGSSSYTQAGRNPFQIAFQENTENLSSSGQVWNSTYPNSSSQSQECNSRCPVSSEQSKSDRMGAPSGNLTQAVLCLRDPPSRHVRHGREQGYPNLHFTLPGRQSLGGQRPLNIMGRLRTSVYLPSGSHCPKDPPENEGLSGHHSDSNSIPNPSRPRHPLPLLFTQWPRIPLTNMAPYQCVPNRRRPLFHREPHLLDLTAWTLSWTSWNNMISQMQS